MCANSTRSLRANQNCSEGCTLDTSGLVGLQYVSQLAWEHLWIFLEVLEEVCVDREVLSVQTAASTPCFSGNAARPSPQSVTPAASGGAVSR